MSSMNVLLPSPSSNMAMRFVNLGRITHHLHALEHEDSVLAHVKVDIAVLFVEHVAPKEWSHNAMPMWIVFLVKFLAYMLCNMLKKGNLSTFESSQPTNQPTNQGSNFSVLTYPYFLVHSHCLFCTIHNLLLHFVRHFRS